MSTSRLIEDSDTITSAHEKCLDPFANHPPLNINWMGQVRLQTWNAGFECTLK